MDVLDAGLIFFFAVHSIPFFPKLRNGLHAKLGERGWKGAFSLASLAGLVLIGFGYSRADTLPFLAPPAWGHDAPLYGMAVAFILIASGNLKGHIRTSLRHPMALGFFVFGASHVMATGDLASVKLFGALALYALVSIVSAEMRGKVSGHVPAAKEDLKAVFAGALAYAAFFFAHGWLFGAPFP